MENQKEIFIEIDESGSLGQSITEKNNTYLFLTCSYISNKTDYIKSGKPFHYNPFISNKNISYQEKSKIIKAMANALKYKNFYYSSLIINKKDNKYPKAEDERDLVIESEIETYFYNFLAKISKNNNLTINIIYDKGQGKLNDILKKISFRFKKQEKKNINFLNKPNKTNINHGYCDFVCSMERVKYKFENHLNSDRENIIFENGQLIKDVFDILNTKNIDKLQFDNFENLLDLEDPEDDFPGIN